MARMPIEWPTNPRYREYLNSPSWKDKRKAVKERCTGICERYQTCPGGEAPHRTYAHLYSEPPEDLQGLCIPCHRLLHEKSGIDPLEKSIHVKVTGSLIEFWDSERKKFRRVKIADLPGDWFR